MANLQKINSLRKQKNLSWKQLSNELNISIVGLQKMISSNSTKIETLEKIAAYFDVPVAYFFEDQKSKDTLTEKQLLQELEKQRIYYETIITERSKGIILYYALAKAFLKLIHFLLSKKLTLKDINTAQLNTIAERFFAIDINKLYGLDDTTGNKDYEIWFEHISNIKDKNTLPSNLDNLFNK